MSGKILYIEDNPLNLRLVRKILVHAGYKVVEAVDGLSGLDKAAEEHPDLILMDINLPDIDGLEAMKRLRATTDLSHIPVVALTANAMHGDRAYYLSAGCDGYISKPVIRKELLEAVSGFFSKSKDSNNKQTD